MAKKKIHITDQDRKVAAAWILLYDTVGLPLEISVDANMIDVTMGDEPDPNWTFKDKSGHVHKWSKKGTVPTLRWIWDKLPNYEDDEDDEDCEGVGHYECKKCVARINPRMRASIMTKAISGLMEASINGACVSEGVIELVSKGIKPYAR